MCGGKSNSVTSHVWSNGLNSDDGAKKRRENNLGRPGRSESAKELERWFNDQLSQLYAEILGEPLPNELSDLLEQLRRDKKARRGS